MTEKLTKAILDRSEPPDVTVTCGPLTLHLHSFLLANNSKFFATMLDAPMVEKESRKVAVKYMEPEVFRKVLGFIYTKKLSLDVVSQLEEMLEAADRFDMEELKEKIDREVTWARNGVWRYRCRNCESGCKENCDDSLKFRGNLVTTAILAERYNAEKLLNRSVKQMVHNNIRPEMEELTNSPKLEVAVIDEYIVKCQEKVSDVKDRRRELKDVESELMRCEDEIWDLEMFVAEECPTDDGPCHYSYGNQLDWAKEKRNDMARRLAETGKGREEEDNREKEAAKMMEEVMLMAFEAWRYSVPDF